MQWRDGSIVKQFIIVLCNGQPLVFMCGRGRGGERLSDDGNCLRWSPWAVKWL